MFAVVNRAIKNVGDALIFHRGMELLRAASPGGVFVEACGWQPLAATFSAAQIGAIRRIIVPGGPGLRNGLRTMYPFLPEAIARDIPVSFLGGGTRYFPAALPDSVPRFDAETVADLAYVARSGPIGVRDYLTARTLQRHGIETQVNGCPAWYALSTIDDPPVMPTRLETVAFTPPAHPLYLDQAVGLLRGVRRLFPRSDLVVGFHRGVHADEHTSIEEERRNLVLVRAAEALGGRVLDLSGSVEKLRAYDRCDIHIGYRVHAHLYFSSLHRPSFLVAEDVRGLGALHAIAGAGMPGWHVNIESAVDAGDVLAWLELMLHRYAETGQSTLEAVADTIRWHWRHRMSVAVARAVAT